MTHSDATARHDVEPIALRSPTLPPATTTNSYLIGHGGGFYVVEPASPYPQERRRLFERIRQRSALGEKLLGAIVTHHHRDHVGCAEAVRQEFGVALYAHAATRDKLAGVITVDRLLAEHDRLLDDTVRVLHTPGHAPGHVCLWHERDRWLIGGDMVASVGTIIVDPDDDGDMTAYLRELDRLAALAPRRIYPAHGEPIDDAVDRLRFYVSHRLAREAKVLAALPTDGQRVTLVDIVASAYADTPMVLWPLATKSARAHLAKLAHDGTARDAGGHWARA